MKKWPDLVHAFCVWDKDNWVCIDDHEISVTTDRNLITDSIEKIHYRKELLQSLSDEAKYLITIVLDTPDDFIECLCGMNGEPKRTRIIAFLNVSGWKQKKISKTFKELHRFVKEYYGG